jgi:hypothetical protein
VGVRRLSGARSWRTGSATTLRSTILSLDEHHQDHFGSSAVINPAHN